MLIDYGVTKPEIVWVDNCSKDSIDRIGINLKFIVSMREFKDLENKADYVELNFVNGLKVVMSRLDWQRLGAIDISAAQGGEAWRRR